MKRSNSNNYSEHNNRMSYLSSLAFPAKGTPEYDKLVEIIKPLQSNPKIKRETEKLYKKALSIINTQNDNGIGFVVDNILREYLLEYNNRIFSYGIRNSLPSSFNVMEAFYKYLPYINIFRLYTEKYHLFSFLDFLDYVTSKDAPTDIKDVLKVLEEEVIYLYNITNKPTDIMFSINNGTEFGVGGVALIRHGTEVSVLLLSGQKTDLLQKTLELNKEITGSPYPGKESIKPAEDRVREACSLLGNDQLWQTLILTRIDLQDNTMQVRYVLSDCGDCYKIETDDITSFSDTKPPYDILPELRDSFYQSKKNIGEYSTLFEISKTALLLPIFFEMNADNIIYENHTTNLYKELKKNKNNEKNYSTNSVYRITRRQVSLLSLINQDFPSNILHTAPPINTEVSGFWKTLQYNQIGYDKKGMPIHGRTWVKKTLSWVQSTDESNVLLATHNIPKVTTHSQSTKNEGYIYTMRSAAHDRDIIKIGLTKRNPETRADELYRNTSSPDKFLVIQEWLVSDCYKAESLIHQTLDQYRLNPQREFFKAPYKIIRKAIDDVIKQIDGDEY